MSIKMPWYGYFSDFHFIEVHSGSEHSRCRLIDQSLFIFAVFTVCNFVLELVITTNPNVDWWKPSAILCWLSLLLISDVQWCSPVSVNNVYPFRIYPKTKLVNRGLEQWRFITESELYKDFPLFEDKECNTKKYLRYPLYVVWTTSKCRRFIEGCY